MPDDAATVRRVFPDREWRCERREIFHANAAARAWSSRHRRASSFREPEFGGARKECFPSSILHPRFEDLSFHQFFHRRWTQNQFAGSRRTAFSKARLTSRMMSPLERGRPFSCVTISSPTSRSEERRV